MDRVGYAGQPAEGLNSADIFLKSTLAESRPYQSNAFGFRNRGVLDPLALDPLPFFDAGQLDFDVIALATFLNVRWLCFDTDCASN